MDDNELRLSDGSNGLDTCPQSRQQKPSHQTDDADKLVLAGLSPAVHVRTSRSQRDLTTDVVSLNLDEYNSQPVLGLSPSSASSLRRSLIPRIAKLRESPGSSKSTGPRGRLDLEISPGRHTGQSPTASPLSFVPEVSALLSSEDQKSTRASLLNVAFDDLGSSLRIEGDKAFLDVCDHPLSPATLVVTLDYASTVRVIDNQLLLNLGEFSRSVRGTHLQIDLSNLVLKGQGFGCIVDTTATTELFFERSTKLLTGSITGEPFRLDVQIIDEENSVTDAESVGCTDIGRSDTTLGLDTQIFGPQDHCSLMPGEEGQAASSEPISTTSDAKWDTRDVSNSCSVQHFCAASSTIESSESQPEEGQADDKSGLLEMSFSEEDVGHCDHPVDSQGSLSSILMQIDDNITSHASGEQDQCCGRDIVMPQKLQEDPQKAIEQLERPDDDNQYLNKDYLTTPCPPRRSLPSNIFKESSICGSTAEWQSPCSHAAEDELPDQAIHSLNEAPTMAPQDGRDTQSQFDVSNECIETVSSYSNVSTSTASSEDNKSMASSSRPSSTDPGAVHGAIKESLARQGIDRPMYDSVLKVDITPADEFEVEPVIITCFFVLTFTQAYSNLHEAMEIEITGPIETTIIMARVNDESVPANTTFVSYPSKCLKRQLVEIPQFSYRIGEAFCMVLNCTVRHVIDSHAFQLPSVRIADQQPLSEHVLLARKRLPVYVKLDLDDIAGWTHVHDHKDVRDRWRFERINDEADLPPLRMSLALMQRVRLTSGAESQTYAECMKLIVEDVKETSDQETEVIASIKAKLKRAKKKLYTDPLLELVLPEHCSLVALQVQGCDAICYRGLFDEIIVMDPEQSYHFASLDFYMTVKWSTKTDAEHCTACPLPVFRDLPIQRMTIRPPADSRYSCSIRMLDENVAHETLEGCKTSRHYQLPAGASQVLNLYPSIETIPPEIISETVDETCRKGWKSLARGIVILNMLWIVFLCLAITSMESSVSDMLTHSLQASASQSSVVSALDNIQDVLQKLQEQLSMVSDWSYCPALPTILTQLERSNAQAAEPVSSSVHERQPQSVLVPRLDSHDQGDVSSLVEVSEELDQAETQLQHVRRKFEIDAQEAARFRSVMYNFLFGWWNFARQNYTQSALNEL